MIDGGRNFLHLVRWPASWCIAWPTSAGLNADVEDITQKTGNYKKFDVFVRMLKSAINRESESVYVDLLTYADLVSPTLSTALPASTTHTHT